ncbi:alpha/beta hydrolase [Rhodoferax sp.]|uniref:alpha/beta fold hydrolase n=1 Tax=Rhodoferax sp. TaxID=50421 RepID=UPI0026310485|nr:alpha/beta hydrolase [Rhodoferax sp.]MDD2918188.1 alpha/beta hydrolase [Rhodoferax sp.]
MNWFENFETRHFEVNGARIFARVSRGAHGSRPALLLLHGFPQSHVMWHRVAQQLQQGYYLVLPDLRGYGDSSKAPGLPDHSNYSKRAMAQDMVAVMDALGVDRFFLCGHDRGGRVAHRLAVDHAARVEKLCVIDIAPTLDMYAATDFAFAKAYYHWFHLIQPKPLPEFMIGGNPLAYLHAKLGGWGSTGMDYIEPAAQAEYERCFIQSETIHAMCEDYRASADIDLEHDRTSRAQGLKIACDTRVLWGARGVVQRLFRPLDLWQAQCAGQVTGQAMEAGHFIPEELPQEMAAHLRQFFTA